MKRPLLVTDPGLAGLPMIAAAIEANKKAGLPTGLFSDIQPNPIEKNVTDGVAAFRAGGHDGVIAFGGGSALDAGKAIALMVGQNRSIFDFEDREDWYSRVNVAGMAPVVAVPTTSGTGSEVGRSSVVTDLRDHLKKIIFHARMMPSIVVADPELTVGLPPHITAAVGMDALSHNLEAYCANFYHPMADGIALQGMKLVWEWLPNAVEGRQGSRGARPHDGGLDDGRHRLPEGPRRHACAQPSLLGRAEHPSRPDQRRGDALCAGLQPRRHRGPAGRSGALPEFQGCQLRRRAGCRAIKLRQDIGIPHTLSDLGVKPEHIARFAPMAAIDLTAGSNPIPVAEKDMVQALPGGGRRPVSRR